ncbi:glycosyltransferase [Paenibacillus sp. sgz302251]|uniref:glycosyltransferase n=1 Tax=Paenibacillus sp. sgz302251 TaxID=3414493 RepID=UPI003C7C0E8C
MLYYIWDLTCVTIGFLLFAPKWLTSGKQSNDGSPAKGKDMNNTSQLCRLSIIIPCRNEEANLQLLLPLLKKQTLQSFEIIVVDDSSEDRTALIAAQHGTIVLCAPPLPKGWIGKSWACWNGAIAANGEFLLFLDADTRPAAAFVERLVSLLSNKEGLVTVQPSHAVPSFREQCSAFFNLVITAGSGAASALPMQTDGFGPCAACVREQYFEIGGHEIVREEMLEHLHLGKRFKEKGHTSKLLLGNQLLQFRMYPEGWRTLLQGWSKSIGLGAGSTPVGALFLVILWFSGLVSSAVRMLALAGSNQWLEWIAAAAIYALSVWTVSRGLNASGSFKWYTKLFYPPYLVFFVALFSYSVLLSFIVRKVSWRGRQINVP